MAAEGILALIIGAFILVWPGITLVTLTIIVGIFALLVGICALIALIGSHEGQRGVLIAGGLFSIIVGCVFIAWPIDTTVVATDMASTLRYIQDCACHLATAGRS